MARFLLILVCCCMMLGCDQLPGHPKPGPEVPRPDQVTDFPTLYAQNCSACHGAQGANGPSYSLANPIYQSLVDEKVLHQIVANDQQGDALVNGMRTSWFKAGTLEGANPPSYKATKPADTVRGQQAYATYCASCHGAAGSSAKSKAGSITQPAFLSLVSD